MRSIAFGLLGVAPPIPDWDSMKESTLLTNRQETPPLHCLRSAALVCLPVSVLMLQTVCSYSKVSKVHCRRAESMVVAGVGENWLAPTGGHGCPFPNPPPPPPSGPPWRGNDNRCTQPPSPPPTPNGGGIYVRSIPVASHSTGGGGM